MSGTPVKPEPTSLPHQTVVPNMVTTQAGQPFGYNPPVAIPPTAPHHQHCFTPQELVQYGARSAVPPQPADPLFTALKAVNAVVAEVKTELNHEVPHEVNNSVQQLQPAFPTDQSVEDEDKENIAKSAGQKRKNTSSEPKQPKKRRESKPKEPKPAKQIIPLHPTVFTFSLDGQLSKSTEGQNIMNFLREGGWPGATGIKMLCSLICDPIMDFCAKRYYPTRRELREYLTHLLRGFPQASVDSLVGNGNDKGFMEKAVYNRRRIRMGKESGN
ncbi:unnamed protein product [Bursaphelenchus xylophilus]|nr:unnamed protein product [Bursaphelenchus xylophilus]CAG9104935.1 unnamed protein product [Bursaphelenchus xylophilus]